MTAAALDHPDAEATSPTRAEGRRRASTNRPGATTRQPLAWRPVLLVVAVKVVVDAAVSGRYGWHRDELYYADAGRHLAAGYVDLPPVTAWVAAGARVLFADSLVGLRSTASLAGAGVIGVTAALCRDLGGARRAQVVAAVAITPLVVGANAMFQTVSFDQLAWALVLWASVRLLQDPNGRRWVVLAAAAALAWQTKFTVAILFGGLGLGLITARSGRAAWRGRAVTAGVALFAVAAAPNLWWEARHGWASVAFVTGRSGEVRDEYPPIKFVLELLLITGVPSLPLAIVGVRWLWRQPVLRALAVAVAFVPPACLALGGKGYYAAPIAVAAFAAGAVAVEQAAGRWAGYGRSLPWILVVTAGLCSPLILPVLPRGEAISLGVVDVRDDYAAELGWPQVAADVARAWHAVPVGQRADTVVVAGNYGVAGAIGRFGPTRGVDAPIVSGHVSWATWPVPAEARGDRLALAVGVGPGPAPTWCGDARPVGHITGVAGVDTEERGWPIWSCHLDRPIEELRPTLRRRG